MTIRTVQTTLVSVGTIVGAADLLTGDTLNLLPTGFLYAFLPGSYGTLGAGFDTYNIEGTIISIDGTGIGTTGGLNTVYILASATIFGHSAALALGGSSNSITNAGLIGGSSYCVLFSGDNAALSNSGTIISAGGDAIFSSGDINRFINSGFISGGAASFALHLNGHNNSITNLGTITGGAGIDTNGGTGLDALQNNGSVIGTNAQGFAYFGSNAQDNIVNNGLMQGGAFAIDLNGGNDVYDGRNGTLVGAVRGGDGNDTIYGGKGAETLEGGDGNDTIQGGGGGDVIRGGLGADTFVFGLGDNGDLIKNLNEGGVKDLFDLRPYFDAINFTGADPRAAGIMSVLQNGADTDIYLNSVFAFRIENVVAAAIDNSYFLFQ